ncbi:MAG: ABC transporter ATP-binding protein, partial [Deltaproteobacteria bacterium]|nr:ABC transporter ATP-binding protein [Deltaproteobacteria bacterium]
MRENQDFLKLENVHVNFHLRAGVLPAVQGANLIMKRGDTLGIVGESGSGKSVMSKEIIRLNPSPPAKTEGKVIFEGIDMVSLTNRQLYGIRGAKISMIFQEPMTSLNPVFTIGTQMAAGLRTHLKLSKVEAVERSAEMLDKVGIPSAGERLRQYPHEFSGGMRQRVMIAMALSCDPTLLIADEPTTALDVTIQDQILELLADSVKNRDMSMILISHDLYVVADTCDSIIVMYAGRQVETGPTREVFQNPAHPYTQGLKDSQPAISGVRAEYLKPIKGMVPNMLAVPEGCAFHPRCQYAEEI